MSKKILASVLCLCLVVLAAAGIEPAYAAPAFLPITAPSAVLLDGTTQRLFFAKTPYMRRAPASTTKILTAIVAVELLPLDQVVTIPPFVGSIEPSKIYLRPGEHYRVRDLVRATLISSANDAAEVLGFAAAGSRANFARHMNKKARSIGCRRSHFMNPSGLPARDQYSTAYDMALIMKEAQRHSFLVDTMKTKTRTIESLRGRRIPLRNHNKMLWRGHSEVIGKTGYTIKARHCFVGHIEAFNKTVYLFGQKRLFLSANPAPVPNPSQPGEAPAIEEISPTRDPERGEK